MSKILIVDDDVSLVDMLQEYLESQHHTVETTDDGNIALEMLKSFQYDLVILDLGIKGLSGVEVCRGYRSAGGAARILMLTGRRTIDQKEEGFNAGADDYITNPFDIREIGARVRALMRRRVDLVEDVLSFGKITLYPNTHSVTSGGSIVHLAPKEFALLEF